MSERYEVRRVQYGIIVLDKSMHMRVVYFDSGIVPDAEARARQLCAELNAAEAKKASEKP